MNYEELYATLGYLFYSVADSDGRVRPAEVAKLKQLIKEQWLPMEPSRDDLGTDAAHYIDIAFDYALDKALRPMRHSSGSRNTTGNTKCNSTRHCAG